LAKESGSKAIKKVRRLGVGTVFIMVKRDERAGFLIQNTAEISHENKKTKETVPIGNEP